MKTKVIFGLFGASGFGREVMPFARGIVQEKFAASDPEVVFVETQPSSKEANGIPVITEEEFFARACDEKYFNIAIANSKVRQDVSQKCKIRGAKPLALQASPSIIYDANDVAEGLIFCAYSTITSNVRIGKFFHSNIYSYVAHDCVIGDYVTFAPRVCCNGNVHIGDHAYIGTGAVIKQGAQESPLIIGEGAIVGMGAVVTKNVAPYTTVVGNPARVFEKV